MVKDLIMRVLKMNCPKCNRGLQIIMDTPLCISCDWEVIFEINGYIKHNLEEKKNENGIMW